MFEPSALVACTVECVGRDSTVSLLYMVSEAHRTRCDPAGGCSCAAVTSLSETAQAYQPAEYQPGSTSLPKSPHTSITASLSSTLPSSPHTHHTILSHMSQKSYVMSHEVTHMSMSHISHPPGPLSAHSRNAASSDNNTSTSCGAAVRRYKADQHSCRLCTYISTSARLNSGAADAQCTCVTRERWWDDVASMVCVVRPCPVELEHVKQYQAAEPAHASCKAECPCSCASQGTMCAADKCTHSRNWKCVSKARQDAFMCGEA